VWESPSECSEEGHGGIILRELLADAMDTEEEFWRSIGCARHIEVIIKGISGTSLFVDVLDSWAHSGRLAWPCA